MIQSAIKNEESKPVNKWPKLFIGPERDYIILCTDESTGMIVWSVYDPFPVGLYKTTWGIEGNCLPFTGTIELRNK